ncbi:MAG: hypothetical protein ACRD1U_09500 [Vicinamibacterales bacterium]
MTQASNIAGENTAHPGIVDRVREKANAQLATQKDRATDGLGTVAQAVRQTTSQLRDQHHDTVAGYIEQAADQLERFSTRLKEKNVNELVRDAQDLARRQPALFIGSAFAVGLIGARFLKSSRADDGRIAREHFGGANEYGAAPGAPSSIRRPEYGEPEGF